ncbi:Elongation factor 1-beta 1 [Capsicum chinense]|nr:Elongation factor 1-beta 1 [Capsicum chinense]
MDIEQQLGLSLKQKREENGSSDVYPNASKYYQAVSTKLSSSFLGKAVSVRFGSQAAPAPAALAKEAAKPADDNDNNDDIDLFGGETEKEKKAAEAREATKASTKKKRSGKSYVLMDFKPWNDETDMKKLEEVVRSIEVEGLLWGESKLVLVGYGIKKKQIMLIVEHYTNGQWLHGRLHGRTEIKDTLKT